MRPGVAFRRKQAVLQSLIVKYVSYGWHLWKTHVTGAFDGGTELTWWVHQLGALVSQGFGTSSFGTQAFRQDMCDGAVHAGSGIGVRSGSSLLTLCRSFPASDIFVVYNKHGSMCQLVAATLGTGSTLSTAPIYYGTYTWASSMASN